MEDNKSYGNVSITNDLLDGALMKVLNSHDNWGVKMLLHGMLQESHKGAEWFIRFAMGEKIPIVPGPGTEVYVSIDRLGYSLDHKAYEASPYNENGFVKCVVVGFRGFHNYGPIVVEVPKLDPSDKKDKLTVRIDFSEFTYADKDLYDQEEMSVPDMFYNRYKGSGIY
jgi:hypothetical protein